MLFNLEKDTGDLIEGYLVPDGFSDQAGIRIVVEGRPTVELDCDGIREAVVASGRHATGHIGFAIDATVIDDLPTLERVSIYDRKTGLLVYRRVPPDDLIEKRVLRLESQLIPFAKLDRALDPHFQYAIRGVERFGHETAMQAFHLNAIKSIYISGRLLIRNYEEFLEKGFDVISQITDPYDEMAERIMLFKRFDKLPPDLLGERDRMLLAPAAEHFQHVDLTSVRALKRAIRTADEKVQRCLFSPLTRLLVSTHPDHIPTRQSIAAAMDMLSRFSIIGLKARPETFLEPIGEFLDLPAASLPAPMFFTYGRNLADLLRTLPAAEQLIELDLILYHFARQSITLHHGVDDGPKN